MSQRNSEPFQPILSTAPSLAKTVDSTSFATALESTGLREWAGPSNRTVRLISQTGSGHFHANFGDSNIAAASSDSMLIEGGTTVIFKQPKPAYTHLAMVSSTTVVVNVTLGHGK